MKAATHLFAAKGYAATTVRDILHEAKVTAPVLYHHFGSKEGVFVALAGEAAQRLDTALEEAIDHAATASGRIRSYCRAGAEVRREYAELAWIVDSILTGPPEGAPRFDLRGRIARSIQRLEGFIRQGIQSGEFRSCDTRHAALAIIGAVEIAARHRVFQPSSLAPDELLDGMLTVILQGLKARPASRRARRK